jgi:3-hydroxyisobutyrate dehydrogenase-like beta-hydroxyacid dehydrogenase
VRFILTLSQSKVATETFKLQCTRVENLELQHKASTHKLTKDLGISMHQSRELGASTQSFNAPKQKA